MMKKILQMLLLGFLTVTVLSPSVVTAEEDQNGQVPSSSVYSEIDRIAPMATPGIDEVTLDNGEFYDFTRKCLFSLHAGKIHFLFKIRTMSGEKEAFTSQLISTVPDHPGFTLYSFDSSFEHENYLDVDYPLEPEIKDIGFRITNISAGPVTYRFGLNLVYGTREGLEFELP